MHCSRKIIHVLILQQLKLHFSILKTSIPSESRCSIVVNWIKPVDGEAGITITINDTGKKKDVRFAVKITKITQGLKVEGLPNVLYMLIILR